MRRVLLILLVLFSAPYATHSQGLLKKALGIPGYYSTLPAPPSTPRKYYIATTGTGSGTTSAAPAPLSLLQSATIISGDSIYFNRGDTFYFSDLSFINVNGLTVGAFGTGAAPVIDAATYIGSSTWNNNGDGTYWMSLATEPNWVWINDVSARLAESAWIPITAAPTTTSRRIASATLSGFSSVVGAKIIFKEFDFRATQVNTIIAQNNGTGDITFAVGMDVGYAAAGMALKIMNQAQWMTTAGDWYYDDVNDKLFVKSATSPSGTNIKITTGNVAMSLYNVSNFSISNLEIKHSYKNVFNVNSCVSPSFTFLNLHDNRGGGIRAYGTTTDLDVNDNTIYNHGMRAVEFGGVATGHILRNTIHDIGTQTNIGFPYDINNTGGTALTLMQNPVSPSTSSNFTISENVIYNIGYQGIQWWGPTFTFSKNVIHDYCLKWNDGGGIHTIYRTFAASSTQTGLIQNNIIYNGYGDATGTNHAVYAEGIYIDNGCNDIVVDNNTVYATSNSGIVFNWDTKNNSGTNNHVLGCANIQFWIREDTNPVNSPVWPNNTGNTLTSNILACRNSTARCVNVTSYNSNTSYNPFSSGGNSNNNAYVHPYATSINSFTAGSTTSYSLSAWRTKIGLDASSTERTNYITFSNSTNAAHEVNIEVNATGAAVNFNVPAGYTNEIGAAFSNPVSIPAYSSLVYFKNTAYP